MKLQSHGIETDLPPGWEGRIGIRQRPTEATRSIGEVGERPNPVVHLANFALPEQRGDFGSGAVDLMGADDVLVVLFEYGPECAGTALFQRQGLPTRLTPNMFSSGALQRTISGQAGCQIFFTEANRAFCAYTVLGQQSSARRVLPQANATLAGTRIAAR
ncbi:hypothetical protein ACE2AJ_18265 [Aquihabitans daechungensis]|uniref:hypothetical protein n=1 Tax=Aquihabitans daechungensis TaxID=1052257 RepID=UPI003BA29629